MLAKLDVRSGSKTEVAPLERHFRSTLKSGNRQVTPACPKSANPGRARSLTAWPDMQGHSAERFNLEGMCMGHAAPV